MAKSAYGDDLEVLWPSDRGAAIPSRVDRIGNKASGLLCVPQLWRPPMAVLSSSSFDVWRASTEGARFRIAEAASILIGKEAAKFPPEWQAGLILRFC